MKPRLTRLQSGESARSRTFNELELSQLIRVRSSDSGSISIGNLPVARAVRRCENGGMIIPKKLPRDSNQRAFEIVRISTGESEAETEPEQSEKSKRMAEIGRKGGLKGGSSRAEKLSVDRRKAIAKKAAQERWKGSKERLTVPR